MDKKENMLKIKQSLTLLYVEDETMVKEASLKSLRRRFKEVYTANDGKEGLELYKKYKPDIVLTDILMPIHNGLEMIKQIREIDKNVPIVVITALTESIYLKQSKEFSIQGYLVKPLNEEQFLKLLYNLSLDLINYGND
ncbi:response regulator with CheY-like receiver domain and winged-helix DNA-binding [Candidatus Magnetobacterium bavaricum]|uniref:Response regulator with CheY-like receiver domain and winged-helix DNA-binding n=1 Tax=Candidatus Magnetobacterium bavaricum TaxID=29290 RepID=A0A0F3GPP5_9BACT|nr:response regulator with CheY-like receiver domain and winged-helix DNA-binding [Candidatus Magnetobacterium bavaricum]